VTAGPPLPPIPADRVCVSLLSGLGDVANALPLVNALVRDRPTRRITWVTEPMPAQLLRPHPAVAEVVVFHRRRGWRGVLELRRELARRRFDVVLNLNLHFKGVWPTLLSRAPLRLGFGPDRARDGMWLASNRRLPAGPRRHSVDIFLEFAEALGVEDRSVEWRIPLTREERGARDAFLAPLDGRPLAAIVPATSLASRDWSADRYARVADALQEELGFRVVLVGGPGARETALAREITARTARPPIWGMGDGVRRLVWLLSAMDLVIAPDTGPVHVARALEVPVIGLYGTTNPWRAGPYRRYQDLWVDAYTDPGAEPDPFAAEPRFGRMERITVEDVLERVELGVRRYLPERRGGEVAP
jgi:heptosyltransferase I